MRVVFLVKGNRLTLDDLEGLEGKTTVKQMKAFAARFAVDENDEYLPEEEATKLIGSLTLEEAKEAFASLAKSLKEWQTGVVPPKIGNVS
jgi:hypothetical protein